MIFFKINGKNKINSHNYSKLSFNLKQYIINLLYFIKIAIIIICIYCFFYYNYDNPKLYEMIKYEDKKKNHINKIVSKIINLELDNKINEHKYEKDIDFSEFRTKIKSIAIYFPNIYLDKFRKLKSINVIDNDIIKYYNIKKEYINEQRQSNNDKQKSIENSYEYNFINNQIKLAKSHGIYGFGIYIYWFSGKIFFDKYIYKFLEIKTINFHFLFILKQENISFKFNKNLIEKEYNKIYPETIIKILKIFLVDKRYIKIGLKPVLCIDNNIKRIENLKIIIKLWKKKAEQIGIGNLFIIGFINNKNVSYYNLSTIYNGGYLNLPYYLLNNNDLLVNFKDNSIFFSGLIYKELNYESYDYFPLFRGSTLENKFKINKMTIFNDYNPEYFYIMNKIILNWSNIFHNETDNLIFINSWNNYKEGTYLEPNPQFGFGSINAMSKALFNLSYTNYIYNLTNLFNKNLIAVQVHIYYIDLINEIINITNNIPVRFDLYITTNTFRKKLYIREYVNKYSKADNFEIKIFKNIGRDVLPLLNQMKYIVYKYKYLCHIHSKKSQHDPKYGFTWRKYLYKNLLGNKELISTILSDFENNDKLGFIFPETFYESKVHALRLNKNLENNINFFINLLFPGYSLGKNLDFPAGNMFWSKVKAVYQIFELVINKNCCKEGKPLTVLYALERIWLFIVKMNGYYYKTICGNY